MLRATLYRAAVALNRSAARELALMRRAQWLPLAGVQSLQTQRLVQLLDYAYCHVPYYKNLFEQTGLVEAGKVRLERFDTLPTLDKPIIRAHFRDLTSDEIGALHAVENRTSGSTGEPLVVLQGRGEVRITGGAVTRLFYEWHGARPGDREIKLWGSERDLFRSGGFSLEGLRQWASGVRMLNAFRMSPERMRAYLQEIDTYHPKVLRGYSSNLYELAQFAEQEGIAIHPPGVVISSAGTLYPALREKMAKVYGCRVVNHYGSREMHCMAMECPESGSLHYSALTHFIEVLDEQGRPCPPGVEGDLVITALLNRAMPLIRYRIGDRGALAEHPCSCGRGLPVLAKLSGRRVDCFWTHEGKMIPGEYFIYLLAVHLHDNPISKFQVLQERHDALRFRLVLREGKTLGEAVRREIEEKTRLVMGPQCTLEFEFVGEIPTAPSGKYFYTLCSIPRAGQPTEGAPPSSSDAEGKHG